MAWWYYAAEVCAWYVIVACCTIFEMKRNKGHDPIVIRKFFHFSEDVHEPSGDPGDP